MAGLRANIYDNVNDTYIWLPSVPIYVMIMIHLWLLLVPIFVIQVPSQMQASWISAVKYVDVCLCGQIQKGANLNRKF